MNEKLKVLIHGIDFAGEGHAEAFRYAGVEVVGMVGRNAEMVIDVAKKMGIPYSGTDWRQALDDCQPDIVSIATPGGVHFKPIKLAISQGCHVFCDKPLSDSGDTSKSFITWPLRKASKRRMPQALGTCLISFTLKN